MFSLWIKSGEVCAKPVQTSGQYYTASGLLVFISLLVTFLYSFFTRSLNKLFHHHLDVFVSVNQALCPQSTGPTITTTLYIKDES